MLRVVLLLVSFTLITAVNLKRPLPYKVKPSCHDHLGCFNMSVPWVTTVHPLAHPIPPNLMAVRVFFHNRPAISRRHEIITYPFVNLRKAKFNPNKMTFFITHGFQSTGNDPWLGKMKDALLNLSDANVFIGEWGEGSKVLSYIQAVSNTRLAAREFSNMFQYLIDQRGLNVTRLHLIGHSLGAHVSGIIGKSIPGIFQITALDPAQPLWNVGDDTTRLTRDDADFVLAVHSDARIFLPDVGFGLMDEVGHIDFYINAGYGQPVCQYPQVLTIPKFTNIFDFFKPLYTIFLEALLCPHQAAVEVFTESISARKCLFWGHAVTMLNLLRGVSNTQTAGFYSQFNAADDVCGIDNCSPLGLDTYFWPARGTFVLITRANPPYCIYEEAVVNSTTQRDLFTSIQSPIINILDEGEPQKSPLDVTDTEDGPVYSQPGFEEMAYLERDEEEEQKKEEKGKQDKKEGGEDKKDDDNDEKKNVVTGKDDEIPKGNDDMDEKDAVKGNDDEKPKGNDDMEKKKKDAVKGKDDEKPKGNDDMDKKDAVKGNDDEKPKGNDDMDKKKKDAVKGKDDEKPKGNDDMDEKKDDVKGKDGEKPKGNDDMDEKKDAVKGKDDEKPKGNDDMDEKKDAVKGKDEN